MRQSRLLKDLDSAVAAATSQLSADCIRAERACYLARQGRTDEARSVVVALRKQYGATPNAAMSAWLSLAEGLSIYFDNMGVGSHDKVLRAHALSVSAGLTSMQALSAAWLSQMDFSRLNIESMAKHVKESIKLTQLQDYAARARASLVLAQALHFARRIDLAMPWYRRAHACATKQGDDAAISALMHNMACMRLDNLRQAKLTGIPDDVEESVHLAGTESTSRFDELIGVSSLKALNPLLIARVHSLQRRPAEALVLYQEHITSDSEKVFARMRSDLLSDVAWCCVQLDRREAAISSAFEAEASLTSETQIDDRAATHTRLGWVYAALGDDGKANRHEALAADEWGSFVELQGRIVQALGNVSEEG
jgi:tetratricopeptide (TPR) repeat protein